ncbi:hypothetical protein IW15_17135 [Chryseobacterium soli]|uniref:Tail sheath protein C-terminal domain-containing protein n=1 Tax=Chryseobacterium soli TaxID=445961 RepID=A0A086A2I5_9FLAO|nr:phage tail sheath C-terminal domain-containing protein [Chryseobacterium soli]KFF10899.1 hypothetical protein IW15_17135 [Chryseobacterium soli]
MLNLTTPGVSVEEITKLPYSIALIETAIPTFIGYTEEIPADYNKPLKISSLFEYEQKFGAAKKESIRLKDVEGKGVTLEVPPVQFLMYYSLQMYFANGGGPCYIISVGKYPLEGEVQLYSLKTGLDMVEKINEPILIILPDAISLSDEADFYTLYTQAIVKAEVETKNRFAILDTYYGNSTATSNNLTTIDSFRNEINSTSYAAAYFPHLKTILNYTFDENTTPITHTGLQEAGQDSAIFYAGEIAALDELKSLASNEISGGSPNAFVLADLLGQAIAIAEEVNEAADTKLGLTGVINEAKAVLEAIYDGTIDNFMIPDDLEENAPVFSGEFDALKDAILNVKDEKGDADGLTLKNLESSNSALYNQVKNEIHSLTVVLPPSSAIAGVYGRVDSTRGVWKAPANVSLNYVVGPTEKVSDQEQSTLNIDAAGKSINAIRTFTGKGTLVWGARTLDGKDKKENGQDNEWKYVHVRRYYNMMKQSISEALGKFINKPNIRPTWLQAKATIENFLHQQWMDGALAGSTPKEAYHVEVGPDEDETKTKTMTATVKIAVARPAEFIVLSFSHKLQEY